MLTQKEQEGIRDILDKLKTEDLFSLTFTVTKGFIKPENKHEAVQAILLYCEKPSLLLRRKKVRKEIIFSYLREQGVVVSVSGEKTDYIKTCLRFWESADNSQNDSLDDTLEDKTSYPCTDSEKSFPSPDAFPAINPYATYCSLDPSEVVRFGHNYVTWFYRLLNQHCLGAMSHESFGEQSFVPDCSLMWMVRDTEQIFKGMVETLGQAIQVIGEMIFANKLTLEPGHEGVLSRYDPHGIMQVQVQGVVHQLNKSVGLFEQNFGLFREPLQNDSWKIKRTDLKMQVNVCLTRQLPIEYSSNSIIY